MHVRSRLRHGIRLVMVVVWGACFDRLAPIKNGLGVCLVYREESEEEEEVAKSKPEERDFEAAKVRMGHGDVFVSFPDSHYCIMYNAAKSESGKKVQLFCSVVHEVVCPSQMVGTIMYSWRETLF